MIYDDKKISTAPCEFCHLLGITHALNKQSVQCVNIEAKHFSL